MVLRKNRDPWVAPTGGGAIVAAQKNRDPWVAPTGWGDCEISAFWLGYARRRVASDLGIVYRWDDLWTKDIRHCGVVGYRMRVRCIS